MEPIESANLPPEVPVKKTTKEKLFDMAVELFSERGTESVSIRDLTRAVGIKESSFYNHFKSKDALIMAIFEALRQAYAQTMPPDERIEFNLTQMTALAFLERGNALFIERMATASNKKIWRILFVEQYRDPRARELIRQELIQRPLLFTEKVFQKLIDMGQVKPMDAQQLAAEYFYPIALLCSYSMMDDENTDVIEQQLKNHVEFFWNLIKK